MTFDALEIWFDLHRHFKLDPKKFTSVHSVSDLANLVIAQTQTIPSASCPTADAFYMLREKLSREFHVTAHDLYPESPVSMLIGNHDPRVIWQRIAKTLAVPLQSLDYPAWTAIFAIPCILTAIVGPLVAANTLGQNTLEKAMLIIGGITASVALLALLEFLLRPILARRIPAHLQTLGGFAYVLAVESKKAKGGLWSRAEITATVQLILARSAGKNPRQLRRHICLELE